MPDTKNRRHTRWGWFDRAAVAVWAYCDLSAYGHHHVGQVFLWSFFLGDAFRRCAITRAPRG